MAKQVKSKQRVADHGEVFTSEREVEAMCDLVKQETERIDSRFLEPSCGDGNFLSVILKRKLTVVTKKYRRSALDWEGNSLLALGSLYGVDILSDNVTACRERLFKIWDKEYKAVCKADCNDETRRSAMSILSLNIMCGNALTLLPVGNEIFSIKFDVIIGNPPYQLNDGGNGVSAAPIFQLFVEQAMKLKPRYLSMIIPARWYAGGKGLNEFREMMLNNRHIRKLVDFESSKGCFSGVNIAGGICYFLWDRDNAGPCEITNCSQETPSVMERELNEFPILIRSNMAVSIVHKVLATGCEVYSDHAYPRNPFGFATNFRGRTEKEPGDIELLTSKGFQYIRRSDVKKNTDIIDHYKVLIGRLVPSNGELDVDPKDGYRVITDTRIIGPGQINTETYLDIGVFKTRQEAHHFDKFLKSKLPRFLLRQAISSLNVTRDCFRFVPYVDFTQEWDDARLYEIYGLTEEEIQLVESTIRPFESEAGW